MGPLGRRLSVTASVLLLVVTLDSAGAQALRVRSFGACRRGTATVQVSGGQMLELQQLVSQKSCGTRFDLPVGSYYQFPTITPKAGDAFIGRGSGPSGTLLFGSAPIPSSHFVGNEAGQWQDAAGDVPLNTQALAVADENPGFPGQTNCVPSDYPLQQSGRAVAPGTCDFPDAVYEDGVMLTRQMSSSHSSPCSGVATTPGTYCVDYGAGVIYLGFNPNGHFITYSDVGSSGRLVQTAFAEMSHGAQVADVALQNLAIEQYPDTHYSVGAVAVGPGWTLRNVLVTGAHSCGLKLHAGATVANSQVSNNGEEGVCAQSVSGSVLRDDTFNGNNLAGYNPGWDAGGVKFYQSTNTVIVGSTVDGNNGEGIWLDGGSTGITIAGNTIVANTAFDDDADGIRVEISCKGTIGGAVVQGVTYPGNVVSGNGRGAINIVDSSYLTVGGSTSGFGNAATVELSGRGVTGTIGIRVSATQRSGTTAACGAQNIATNDTVENNVLTLSGADAQQTNIDGLLNNSCASCVNGDSFSGDVYLTGGNCGHGMWQWFDSGSGKEESHQTFPEWQGFGQDKGADMCT